MSTQSWGFGNCVEIFSSAAPACACGSDLTPMLYRESKVWDLLDQINQLTLDYIWKQLPSTTRRKKLTKRTLGLN
jgi:hypothetical protein